MTRDDKYYEFWLGLVAASRQRFHESCRDSLTTGEVVRAKCMEYTKALCDAFPELRRVCGFYTAPYYRGDNGYDVDVEAPGQEHWWCVTPDGVIVDPTAAQFIPGGEYIEFDDAIHTIRLGRCMACGSDIYGKMSQGRQEVCPGSKPCYDIMVGETS